MTKDLSKMTLDELIEHHRNAPPMTEKQIEDQICGIAAAESRMAGDKDCTADDIRFIRERDKQGI